MAEKTAADRRHEIVLLVLGFALTTVLGGLLTFFFQSLENEQQANAAEQTERLNLTEDHRQQATELFKEVSEVLDTRLYRWRQLAWGIEDGVPEPELQARYGEYRDTLRDWVYRLNRRRALLCRFFGPEIGGEFENRIMPEFNRLHARIIDLVRMPRAQRDAFSPNQLNSEADQLNNVTYLFNNRLAEAIRSGNVGSVDPGGACDFSAVDPVH